MVRSSSKGESMLEVSHADIPVEITTEKTVREMNLSHSLQIHGSSFPPSFMYSEGDTSAHLM